MMVTREEMRPSTPVGSVGYGGRYRIRTYDFHRVKMALYR